MVIVLLASLLNGCQPPDYPDYNAAPLAATQTPAPGTQPTPLPARPYYQPGELVDYIAQDGDNLPALAVHFNTTVKEIRAANKIIPNDVTTLPPGLPMKIPIYYQALWGTSYHILPDALFVNGPAQIGFDTVKFVDSQPGWFKNYEEFAGGKQRRGGELIDHIAYNFSISPRLLLAVMEYQTHALSEATPLDSGNIYPLGFVDVSSAGLYNQLVQAANTLNNSYYDWRTGKLTEIIHLDGSLEHPDPWQNASTVALQFYYSRMMNLQQYTLAIQSTGLAKTYQDLFGDPWKNVKTLIPGSLTQPPMNFPFLSGSSWAFTGGPHTGWGDGSPFAAIDFAPPSVVGGCTPTEEWATAVANGVISRTGQAIAVLDLDGDGDERTGWVVFYLHLATDGLIPPGTQVKLGDPVGHPSCEGGRATGTHVHIARKYNGEWIPAGGALAFNLEGWQAVEGSEAYQGKLVRFSRTVEACECSNNTSLVSSGQ